MGGLLFGQTSSCQWFVRDAGCRTRVELWQVRYQGEPESLGSRLPAPGGSVDHLGQEDHHGHVATTARAPTTVNVAEAKRRLSELVGRVAFGGARVLITRRGRPMAKLVPPDEPE